MTEDELLAELGRLARAQAKQAEARQADAAALLRPLDAAARERIVARLLPLVRSDGQPQPSDVHQDTRPSVQPLRSDGQPELRADAQPESRADAKPELRADGQPELRADGQTGLRADAQPEAQPRAAGHAEAPPRAAGRRRARARRWALVAAPALAAAAVLLWLAWPGADAGLPMYVAELSGGRALERGAAADAPIRVGTGDRVSAVLRPATAVSEPVSVRAFVDGRALSGLQVERSADGALRVTGLGPALAALPPGRHRLWFAVGWPDALPDTLPESVSDTMSGDGGGRPGVQLLRYEVERIQP